MTETKKVNIELEVDTNVVDSSKNQISIMDRHTGAIVDVMENIP